jgi:hypothetical protein
LTKIGEIPDEPSGVRGGRGLYGPGSRDGASEQHEALNPQAETRPEFAHWNQS